MASPQTILSLLNLPHYGKKTVMNVVGYLETELNTPDELINFLSIVTKKVKRAKVPNKDAAQDAVQLARRTISESESTGIHILAWGCEKYPERLKLIPDPPPILYAKGDLTGLSAEISVALIGTRDPSEFGRKSAFAIGKGLATFGAVVVSGLALGCDAEGHLGCLEGKGATIAVLAHGLDHVSPKKNRPLADRIILEGGCLVSEYAPGVEARRNHFVERDRIQSGLSDAVIVAEIGLKGGTMHTVGFCESHGRRLACVKHPEKYADLQSAEGNKMLIEANRAVPLTNKNDLEGFLHLLSETRITGPSSIKNEKKNFLKENQTGFSFENDE